MSEACSVGRRPAGQEEVGRTRIRERTRALLKERSRTDLQRQDVARKVGGSPALISYYFPDMSSLFKAATELTMEDYIANV